MITVVDWLEEGARRRWAQNPNQIRIGSEILWLLLWHYYCFATKTRPLKMKDIRLGFEGRVSDCILPRKHPSRDLWVTRF